MSGERPKWCEEVKCPFYRNFNCYLKNEIVDGWHDRTKRNKEYNRLNGLAQENKKEVIDSCDYSISK